MNLLLVTFLYDYSEFLVDAQTDDEAIKYAMEANKSGVLGRVEDSEYEMGINDPTNYYVNFIVNDMNMLNEIIRRDDYAGIYNGVIIFNGVGGIYDYV